VRAILGSFLFSGDDVDKKIGVLSGGERARVALAKLLVVPSNLLLMDEPTNHLDLDSSEALIEALQGYDGTLLFVSHNRSFVNGLATQVWEVKDGKLDPQPGNLDDWQRRRAAEAERTAALAQPAKASVTEKTGGQGKDARRERAVEREKRSKLLGPLKKEVAQLEARINELETEKKSAETQLADPAVFADKVKSVPLVTAYRAAEQKLEELMARWEHKQEELSAAEAKIEAELGGA
jgi:ATP-binding cassette subfamily F protein 3